MAKTYSTKAKRQLMPSVAEREKALKKLVSKVDGIFAATKQQREKMRRHRKLFEGDLWNKGSEEYFGTRTRSDAQYNIIFATIETLAPLLTDNRPITMVKPKFAYMEKIGIRLNHAAKYVWETEDMQMLCFKAVLDSMINSYAIVYVGYNPFAERGSGFELNLIDPVDFFIAPGYDEIDKAPYCGVKRAKPLSWIKENFPHIDVKKIKCIGDTDTLENAFKFGTDVSMVELDTKFATVYEMWIRDDDTYEDVVKTDTDRSEYKEKQKKYPYGKMCWFTSEQYLAEMAVEDNHGLSPYVALYNYIKTHDFTGISEIDMIEGLHKDLNLNLKWISEYVGRYHNPNQLADVFSGFDVDTFKNTFAEGGHVYAWDSAGGTRNPPITPMQEPQFNPNVFNYFSIIPSITQDVTGVTDTLKGQVGKSERQSASEIAILRDSSDIRTRQKIRNLESFLKKIFYRILRMMMQYYQNPRSMAVQEVDGVVYATYGNSRAQADEIMQPQPLSKRLSDIIEQQRPIDDEDAKRIQEYSQEETDYQAFVEAYAGQDMLDPVYFDFDVEIQSDSMLPMDKQSRVNEYKQLYQMKAIDVLSLLEQLRIPNSQEIVKRLKEQYGGGGNEQMQAMLANPQAAQQYLAQRGGKQ